MNQPDLSHNHYQGDHADPHIILADAQDRTMLMRLVIACPAGLYQFQPDGSLRFDVQGCLECGTCRLLCGKKPSLVGAIRRRATGLSFASVNRRGPEPLTPRAYHPQSLRRPGQK